MTEEWTPYIAEPPPHGVDALATVYAAAYCAVFAGTNAGLPVAVRAEGAEAHACRAMRSFVNTVRELP